MELFVRRDNATILSNITLNSEQSLETVITNDCSIYKTEIQIGDIFIDPGIIIRQQDGEIHGYRPNSFKVFSFRCESTLTNFVIDSKRLFGLDKRDNAHIFHMNGTTPEIHPLHTTFHGWCIVPHTRLMIGWNLLTIHVYGPEYDTTQTLDEHNSRITAGTSSSAMFATGDSIGTVCIWYVAGLACHHKIRTGSRAIVQLLFVGSYLYVRTAMCIFCYDNQSGTKKFEMTMISKAFHHIKTGLLISTPGYLRLFKYNQQLLKIKHDISRFVTSSSTPNRFWSINDRIIEELDLTPSILKWPTDCIHWIQHPKFPFHKTWPTGRYMDVLAMSVDEWMPEIQNWDPPRQWFRHIQLRTAIWNWTIVNDISLASKWMFLSEPTLSIWYNICLEQLKTNCGHNQTNKQYEHTIEILTHLKQNASIEEKEILQWCWMHHGKIKLKPIIRYLAGNDKEEIFIQIINTNVPSPDGITCLGTEAIRSWCRRGYVAVFIRMLCAYHRVYQYGPTRETRETFKIIVYHLFMTLEPHNCDQPLAESGDWVPKEKFMPDDINKYVKSGNQQGFITSVVPNEDGTRKITWRPSTSTVNVILDDRNVEIWDYIHTQGPYTLLDCTIKMVNGWNHTKSIVEWTWFSTELGAFAAESKLISVFDTPMRVLTALWCEEGASFTTNTLMEIIEKEQICIEIESPSWSYIKENVTLVVPLQLKLCHIIPLIHKPLKMGHIEDILSCCRYKSSIIEQTWEMNGNITVMTSNIDFFFTGLENGIILEYENIASFEEPIRTFKGHDSAVTSLHIMDKYLVSMSEEIICVWCLQTGLLVFNIDSELGFVAVVPADGFKMWIIEHSEWSIATLWDLNEYTYLCRINLPLGGDVFYAFQISGQSTLVTDTDVTMWSTECVETTFRLNLNGNITCVTPTTDALCGGTSQGELFSFDCLDNVSRTFAANTTDTITAMSHIHDTDIVVIGTSTGEISLLNINRDELEFGVCVSIQPIKHIHVQNMFVIVTYGTSVCILSIVQTRSEVACYAIIHMMQWSQAWKARLMHFTKEHIKPVVSYCLRYKSPIAIDLIYICTEEYGKRSMWCSEDICDFLLDIPLDVSRHVLKRLMAFCGPRIECAICVDDTKKDTVSFLPACHHRFHTECITEHIRKTPEYHAEMQYQYALSVELKCPICRQKFKEEDVKLDTLLNCT